jgi:hypothetical protein
MPNNWEEWDKAHGRGGDGGRSADKLAAMIKGTLGHTAGSAVPAHGTHGSVVHQTTKKDLKRPAPVKGEKDRADSMRTKIRMAAYQRKKAAATGQDPVDKATPKVEQKVNPHESSAAKIAAQIQGPSKVDREAESRRLQVAAPAAGQTAFRTGTAEDHQKAADQYRQLQKVATRKTLRDWANGRAQEHEAGVFAAKNKAAGPTAERQTAQIKGGDYESARHEAYKATRDADNGEASPAKDRAAAAAHARAANLAPDEQKQRAHDTQARLHRTQAKQVETAHAAPATGPTAEQKTAHFKMVSERASLASETAKTASEHRTAAKAHERAAELAPTAALRTRHQSLSTNHAERANVEDRNQALFQRQRDTAEVAARERAVERNRETAAAKERVAARQAAAKSAPNWETLSQRAQSATVLADKSPTKENHQAASDAHQRAADAARGIDDQVAAEHREMAGRHQVVVDSKGRSQSTGKAGSMGASLKSAQPKTTYKAEYKGQTVTRTSAHPYTHAAVYRNSKTGEEYIGSFHGSEAAARKGSSPYIKPHAVVPAVAQTSTPRASALTTQNLHKALEGSGLQRRDSKGPAQRDFRGNIVQRSSGSGEGRYTLIKDSDYSHRVVVHGDPSTPGGAARYDANQTKAKTALQARGWTVDKTPEGVYGNFRVSPPKA